MNIITIIRYYVIGKMDHITIKFPNDTRTINLDRSIVVKYPHSVISAHIDIFPELHELELNITYESFDVIYDVLIGKRKQWQIPEDILQLASKFGLVNDELFGLDSMLNVKRDNTFARVDDFLNTPRSIFVPDCIADYIEYKRIFAARENIIPFQIVTVNGKICAINIYCGIPIYFDHQCSGEGRTFSQNNIVPTKSIDVNDIRHRMIITGHDLIFSNEDYETNLRTAYLKLYDVSEIEYMQDVLEVFEDMRNDFYGYIAGYSECIYPSHIFNGMVDAETCHNIIEIMKYHHEFFPKYIRSIANHTHLSKFVSRASSEYYYTHDYYYHGYFGFINV